MKTRYILALAATVLFGMSSCSDDIESYGSNEVQLNVTVGSGTRTQPHVQGAEALQFSEGDILKVEADGQTASYMYTAQRQWKAQGTQLLWIKNPMTVKAVYPATAAYDSFDVPVDQSTVEKITSADYMTYDNPAAQNAGDGILNIEMHRQVARVIINTQFNDEYNGTVPTIRQLTLSACGSVGGTALQKYTPYVSGSTYTAIVAPTAADAAATFVKIVVADEAGKVRAFDINGIRQLEAGASYTFNVMVGKKAARITGVTLDPWADGTLPGGEDIDVEKAVDIDASKNLVTIIKVGNLTADVITKAMNGGDKLVISGPMNGADFKVLREYMGLDIYDEKFDRTESPVKELDLSNVNVVAGGGPYYNMHYGEVSLDKDNVLGAGMFQSLNKEYAPVRKIILPDGLEKIYDSAFEFANVEEVVLNQGVTLLFSACFRNSSIKTLNIPSSVRVLDYEAFAGCNGIKRIELPEGVESVNYAFSHMQNLEYVSIPSTVTWWKGSFEDCTALTTLKFLAPPFDSLYPFGCSPEIAARCDLYLNQAWQGDSRLDLSTKTFNGSIFKSITLVNADGTPAQ